MYNRYIPQSDGSFQRSRMEDRLPEQKTKPNRSTQPIYPIQEQHPAQPEQSYIPTQHSSHQRPICANHKKQQKVSAQNNRSVLSFVKQLFPKDFDTSDLMIVLLLLIMSGDCAEDQNTALLTLVLYLFL